MSERMEAALRELARDVRTPAPDPGLAGEVRHRIEATSAGGSGSRVRWLVALAVALLLSGLAVSPVGAKVADWLDFHGVMVRDRDSGLSGTPAVPSEPSRSQPSRATFRPLVPTELGEPDGLTVGADGRLVSMSWTDDDGTIRIDQFDAELDPMFWKSSPDAEHVTVAGGDAIWFPTPHEVVVTVEGELETYPPRLAASTLVVPWGGVTVRLEGDLERERAVEIVESLE